MSSTWRYVSEARGHLVEIYEQLLDMPLCRPQRHLVGMNPSAKLLEADMKASREWYERRVDKVMAIVGVLERHNVAEAIADWRDHAIAFIRKTPSARVKMKFTDEDDRILFLCVALWYARVALNWLEVSEDEGLLRGGVSYREMTAQAARLGSWQTPNEQAATEILPEESSIVDELDEEDPRVARYQRWTYIDIDFEDYL